MKKIYKDILKVSMVIIEVDRRKYFLFDFACLW